MKDEDDLSAMYRFFKERKKHTPSTKIYLEVNGLRANGFNIWVLTFKKGEKPSIERITITTG